MILIAAVDRNWAIGKQGRLLVKIPKDQKLFLEETLGKTLIMGRKTFEDLPGGQPLYGRDHIVLSRDTGFSAKGATVCRSVEEALERVSDLPDGKLYIAGGEDIYRLFLPYCDTADITMIDYVYDGDRFCPNLELDPEWELVRESEEETYFDLAFTFQRYRRVSGGRKRPRTVV